MSEQNLAVQDNGMPVLADDTLVMIAKQAEARIDAVIKIKQIALKVTNANDWCDQDGKPYLEASGSEKVANVFNISWRFLRPEPAYEEEPDGHYTYTYSGEFCLAGRTIEVEGSRSSKDGFFKQNVWNNGTKTEKDVRDRDNKRDVKMAALTNLLGNGITRILGIRNLTYADLEKFAGIKKEEVKGVKYNKAGDKADKTDMKAPQEKNKSAEAPKDLRAEVNRMAEEMIQDEQVRADYIIEKTTYDYMSNGEKKHFTGTTDLTKISDKAMAVLYGKIKKDYEGWLEQQGA
jgi:hypothetical protein